MDDSAYCFDTTIAANLRVADHDATDEQLWEVLRRARLADWVAGLPRKLATPVGEHGGRLSGGQRRRLAVARVLLAGAPILVLDEPTEHLDEPTAATLTADLLAAAGNRSLLLITHRPFGLSEVDDVVHLRQH
jgi:ATP-binding cassette subfamily C protein CydC